MIAHVPADWVVDRGRHWLLTWRSLTDDAENAAFMVLTACRIWHFAVENAHCSKAQAAQWALARRPGLTAIRQALRQYEHDATSVVDEHAIAELLDCVLDECLSSGEPVQGGHDRRGDGLVAGAVAGAAHHDELGVRPGLRRAARRHPAGR